MDLEEDRQLEKKAIGENSYLHGYIALLLTSHVRSYLHDENVFIKNNISRCSGLDFT